VIVPKSSKGGVPHLARETSGRGTTPPLTPFGPSPCWPPGLPAQVTNGSRLDAAALLRLRPHLDQIAFSVDASSDDLHVALGRRVRSRARGVGGAHCFLSIWVGRAPCGRTFGHVRCQTRGRPQRVEGSQPPAPNERRGVGGHATGHLARVRELWAFALELGFALKLNTVVTRLNM
jgi:hypothetical protein